MKKLFIVFALLAVGFTALAQPRGIGLRKSWCNLIEVSYQHALGSKIFLQADLGFDYNLTTRMVYRDGSLIPSAEIKFHPGATLTTTANMILFEPQWTSQGKWEIYAGAGLSFGWANDRGSKCKDCGEIHRQGMGFMFSFPLTGGLSYQFNIPIRLAAEIRPQIGFHMAKNYPSGDFWRIGFYDYGLYGLIPSIAAYYTF